MVFGLVVVALSLSASTAAASPPDVELDEPANATTGFDQSTEITVTDGELVIAGEASDEDGISHLIIARTYEYHDGEDDVRETEIDRYYSTPGVSNGTFEHRVPLGTGTNEVNVSVVDGAGYPARANMIVHVEDDEAPTAHRLEAAPDGEWVHLTGWVRDNVQVDEVQVANQTLQTQTGERDLDREDVRLDDRVPRPDGDNLTITLVDQAGNSREVVVPIGGEQTATPTPTATPTKTPQPAAPPTTTPTPNTTAGAPASTPRVATATDTPTSGGSGPLSLLGVVIVAVAALAMLSVGGGGW